MIFRQARHGMKPMPCLLVISVIATHRITVIAVIVVIDIITMLQFKTIGINDNISSNTSILYFVFELFICNQEYHNYTVYFLLSALLL